MSCWYLKEVNSSSLNLNRSRVAKLNWRVSSYNSDCLVIDVNPQRTNRRVVFSILARVMTSD
mgnify:CR=1 FL=1